MGPKQVQNLARQTPRDLTFPDEFSGSTLCPSGSPEQQFSLPGPPGVVISASEPTGVEGLPLKVSSGQGLRLRGSVMWPYPHRAQQPCAHGSRRLCGLLKAKRWPVATTLLKLIISEILQSHFFFLRIAHALNHICLWSHL